MPDPGQDEAKEGTTLKQRLWLAEQAVLAALARAEAAEKNAEKWHTAWVNNANRMEAKCDAAEARLSALTKALALAKSMIRSGERMTPTSEAVFDSVKEEHDGC